MPVLAAPERQTPPPLSCACPVCGAAEHVAILEADGHPALLHALASTPDAARQALRADLRFVGCLRCGMVRNRAFRPDRVPYGPEYLNTQRASATYLAHENGVVVRVAELSAERPGAILEIGSGDGTVVRRLHELTGRSCIGFDPAGPDTCVQAAAGAPLADDRSIRLVARRFDRAALAAHVREPIAVACARHVIEHVHDPLALLRAAHDALADGTPLVVEVPDTDWICRNGAFYDLFHEHCCLFDGVGLAATLAHAGFRVVRMRRTFGGQYLVATAVRTPECVPLPDGDHRPRLTRLAERVAAGRDALLETLQHSCGPRRHGTAAGPIAIWGAGAKGVSLAHHLAGPATEEDGDAPGPRCVLVDEHPAKQGRFAPGTGCAIVAPERLAGHRAERTPALVLAMNPNYRREIRSRLDRLEVHAPLHLVTELAARALRR